MAEGSTYKRCSCRDAQGNRLGQRCAKLKRRGGAWSANHGRWYYQLELPPTADGRRRNPLRRGGFSGQDAAESEMDTARELLAIADDVAGKTAIADLIIATVKKTKALPDPEEVRRKVRTGQELTGDITVGQWLEEWIAGRKKLRKNTRRSYASHIRLYYKPNIGHIRLDRLRVGDVATAFEAIDELNDLITQARASGDPALRGKVKGRRLVGPASKQRIRATLRAALNQAMRERLIDINVAALFELPPGKRPKALVWTPERITAWRTAYDQYLAEMEQRKRRLATVVDKRYGGRVNRLDAYVGAPRPSPVMVWTPLHTSVFLDRARRHRLYAQYHLIAFRGLRRGESCGLRWPDVDLDDGTITVRWQIIQLGGDTDQGEPKSEAGERQISLDKQTIRELKTHKARQNAERLAAGDRWTDSGFVFTTQHGQPLHPAYVTEEFEQLAMEAGLPPIRLHDLRHGAATILLRAGHDMKIVQETLGLSSITIASDTYTSVLPDLARQSAEDAAAVILKAGNPRKTRRPPATDDGAGRVAAP
jgi:integrase